MEVKLCFADGGTYIGGFNAANCSRTGKGKYTFLNGDFLDGNWDDSGFLDGEGCETVGVGKFVGRIEKMGWVVGILSYNNGDSYDGKFRR